MALSDVRDRPDVRTTDDLADGGARRVRVPGSPRWAVGRRGVQVALGILWILDGLLQFQPALLTGRFAREVVAPAAAGQPAWVAWPVLHAAHQLGAHAFLAGAACAIVQLLLGAGLLVRRTVRPALVASIVWAGVVWVAGEGLGGIAGGTASFVTGAPGAALLYALLGLAALPPRRTPWVGRPSRETPDDGAVASWFPVAWAVLWIGLGAAFLFPTGRSGTGVADQLRDVAGTVPAWLGAVDRAAAAVAGAAGPLVVILVGVAPVLIGLGGLAGGRARRWAAWAGIGLATVTWLTGEALGQLGSGTATDPNSAPLLVLAALTLLGTTAGVPGAQRPRTRPLDRVPAPAAAPGGPPEATVEPVRRPSRTAGG